MDENNSKKAFKDLLEAEAKCTSIPYGHLIKSQKCWVRSDLKQAWQHINDACLADPNEPRFLHFRGTLNGRCDKRETNTGKGYLQSTLAEGSTDSVSQEKELADYMKILDTMNYKRKAVIHNNIGYIKYVRR